MFTQQHVQELRNRPGNDVPDEDQEPDRDRKVGADRQSVARTDGLRQDLREEDDQRRGYDDGDVPYVCAL